MVQYREILLVEKRDHIGGNSYDCFSDDGILYQKYGAHIFHTSYEDVWRFLQGFTKWNNYRHKVIASVSGKTYPIPINRTTINRLLNKNFTK